MRSARFPVKRFFRNPARVEAAALRPLDRRRAACCVGCVKNPGWLLVLAFTVLPLTASAAQASTASLADLGNNTFSCTREATTTFGRDTDKLIAEAKDDAAKFCAAKSKQPKIVSISFEKPWMTLGFPKATVVFKALDAGDPALADTTPVPVVRTDKKAKPVEKLEPQPAIAPRPVSPPASSVDTLYADLTKLDELRKKGILTEEEFQAEKKKVLERSK